MYVEPRKMVQMNQFAGQKLRHRCREQTYGHQGGKTAVGWGWWCAELGDWDWHVYNDVYKTDDWLKKKKTFDHIYITIHRRIVIVQLYICEEATWEDTSWTIIDNKTGNPENFRLSTRLNQKKKKKHTHIE